tara:strand:+ start:140 stop:703 length:564 start_codon:yes stop_codon:yes gene_type:complete
MNFSTVIDRIFDGTSRIGNDACDLTNKNKQNIATADYMLENFSTLNPFNNALNLAFNQPNVVVQGSPKGGTNSDYVDANNVLTFGQGTNMRERGLIQQRIFNAVPYLGKGPANTPLENTLRTGVFNCKFKSTDPLSEVTNFDLTYTPLIPSLEAELNNPANYVEVAANEGWIRGGVPSRLLTREEDN